ncbi:MAG: DUF799 domain-containing protein [Bacteroidales bacterium]|nr:DUF799 domain-containing protein [Bacteroidales bacterium]
MRKPLNIIALVFVTLVVTSCGATRNTKGMQYAKLYEEQPVTLLIMPPINNTTNVEAKDLFFTSVSEPLAEAGYYVISPLMAMEIFRNESAYDAELFIDAPLGQFKEYFGADAVVFSRIESWKKVVTGINTKITYIVKSTTTNEVLFERTCNLTLDYTSNSTSGGLLGALIDVAVAAIETAVTDHIEAARLANECIFKDIPVGKYHPRYMQDMEDEAQPKVISRNIKG